MSGTSLDGVDICYAEFYYQNEQWQFKILKAETIPYSSSWSARLAFNANLSATALLQLDHDYGKLLGQMMNDFIANNGINHTDIDLVASHGHTLYHQPRSGYTFQLGNGPEIFAATKLPVVCDFRRQDVALGGQGAPLVPIGDQFLFSEYEACLNLGGFSNISFTKNENRLAFDICPVNFVLNSLAMELGYEYDYHGRLASDGKPDEVLLTHFNQLEYYSAPLPKSLGAEWVNSEIFPSLKESPLGTIDKLRTFTEHTAEQISRVLNQNDIKTCLVTGGGAYNDFLIKLTRSKTNCDIIIPEKEIIEYKEALIFAFMGVLRKTGSFNILHTVTGASQDHSSGIMYG